MNNNLNACKLLRQAAINNIREYSLKNSKNFDKVWKYYCCISDAGNISNPIDYYINLYNNTIELIDN